MTEIKLVKKREDWEGFFSRIERRSFPQSWDWGQFQKNLGNCVWRLGVFEKNKLVGTAQLISQEAKRGRFLILPHGPSFLKGKRRFLPELISSLIKLTQKEGAWFLRVAPFWLDDPQNRQEFFSLGFRLAPIYLHAERTWNLALTKEEGELLREMRKNTRYSIRKAIAAGVRVEKSRDPADIRLYRQLEEKTVKRKHFTPYSFEFEKKLFSLFSARNEAVLLKGVWRGEVLAAALVIFWQKRAFYYLGASWQKYPQLPVSSLVQWEAIKEARRRRCRFYNFWGITPEDNPRHPWWGITLFKKGFGGFEERLMPTMDLVLDYRYWGSWLIETIRRKWRKL